MAFFSLNQNRYGKTRRIRSLPSSVNVGTLIFGLILVYILITLLLYLTQKHIAGYEVVEGTISGIPPTALATTGTPLAKLSEMTTGAFS